MILKTPMRIISKPVVCASDNSALNRSVGRTYIVHKRNGFELWKDISDQRVSVLEISKIVSEYDQEIPQSQTADNPVAP